MTVEWRKVHNEELIDVNCSPNIVRMTNSRRMRWEGNVARMGQEKRVKDFGGDNIRMDPQGVGCGYMDWIGLAYDRDT